jgi:hypothetical protein
MAFCSFSKDGDANSYVTVENKFITKYLPEVDGFAVKVYLYGLYLCKNSDSDFGLKSMAEVLKTTEEKITQAFEIWEDYDLVEILSRDPFAVQYLPVKSAVGRPKKVHYEQYADFNKELQRQMQKVGKFISAGDYLKYMRFLEENAIQPQALLLIAEYCINKQGDAVSASYIFNKAKKLLRDGICTYEQVERALSNYNAHEKDLLTVFNALGANSYGKAPTENDYSLYRKWTETLGFAKDGVVAAAKSLKRGSMNSLDITLEDLYNKKKTEAEEITAYLAERETLANLTFRIARKLGVKVSNPTPYVDEYVEKWYTYGFECDSLLDIALFCLKTEQNGFDGMHAIVEKLFALGVISTESVKSFLKEKNDDLKLFAKIKDICGAAVRRNATNVSLINTWRSWNFNDEMILEAAKRSAASGNPIPYINKILSDWKRQEVFAVKDIPENAPTTTANAKTYINAAVEAANAKSDRERYYAKLREQAQKRADSFIAKANANETFKSVSKELARLEIAQARAEISSPQTLPDLLLTKKDLLKKRVDVLQTMGISESDLTPQYTCKKCSDTGFLQSGTACDCYKK